MSVVLLGREYASRQGAPVIHAVDPAIFTLRYFSRCLDCSFCNDQCCDHGVDIDADNAARLLALGDDFARRIPVPHSEWFTTDSQHDAEFPSGRYVRTQVRNGKCVFHVAGGRGCAIHGYALEKGLDYHPLKPLVSTLFPVTFEHGVLVPSGEVIDRSLACAGSGPTLYRGARDELTYYFGEGLTAGLDALEQLDARQPSAAGM